MQKISTSEEAEKPGLHQKLNMLDKQIEHYSKKSGFVGDITAWVRIHARYESSIGC
jgi:hypothetical protein